MARCSTFRALFLLCSILSIALPGCGGGGGGGGGSDGDSTSSNTQPQLNVSPENYNFGVVTDGNFAETLEVTIQNTGTANLSVSDINSDSSNFALNVNAGSNPCASTAPIISAGGSCTVTVDFLPGPYAAYSADLTIQSNDPNSPVLKLGLTGSKEVVTQVNVKINQIDACLRPNVPATVYVSVIDQGGYPVAGLSTSNFAINEVGDSGAVGVGEVPPLTATQINDQYNLSIALAMDYSRSITDVPENVKDMENAVTSIVNALAANDEAEIIKFATEIETTEPFTSDKALLTTAIQSTPNIGTFTALYDAVVKAVDDTSTRTNDRKAIIVITDGFDYDGTSGPISENTLDDVIADANAKGSAVFTVGLGDADSATLQKIASETGGTYYAAATSDNLIQVYNQLAALLFEKQYMLTYSSNLTSTETGKLTVTATNDSGDPGSDTRDILACQ